jgi:Helix-turn-helix domain
MQNERNETQRSAILRHLMKGKKLTPMEALDKFGAFRLAAHINVLRGRGHLINTHMIQTGDGRTYAQYEYVGGAK